MAKIPIYQEKSHLSGLSPVGAVDPALARREGQRLEGLGNQILQFNQQLDRHRSASRAADEAVLRNEIRAMAHSMGHKGLTFAKENPEATPDGSSMGDDFNQAVRPLFEHINKLPSHRQDLARSLALRELQGYQQKVREARVVRRNAYLGDQTVEGARQMVLNISNTPENWESLLSNQLELINSMPVSVEERLRATREAQLEASLAVVNAFEMKSNFAGARDWLLSEESRYLDREQRQKALDRINNREVQYKTSQYKEEDRLRRETERLDKEQNKEMRSQLWTELVAAESEEQRLQVLDKALSLGDPVFYRALQTQDTVQSRQLSAETEFLFNREMADGNFSGLQHRINKAVVDGQLTSEAGSRLIRRAQVEQNKTSSNPRYATERRQAQQLVDSAIPINKAISSRPGYLESVREQRIAVQNRSFELQDKEGLSPLAATRKALNEVRIDRGQGIIVPNIAPHHQLRADQLRERLQHIQQNFKAIENPTPEQIREYRRTLEAAKQRIEALTAAEEMQEMMGGR
jgi:hypothetical protein